MVERGSIYAIGEKYALEEVCHRRGRHALGEKVRGRERKERIS